VRDVSNEKHCRYVQKQLGLNAEEYINSGVLVFNIEQCLKNNFRQRCLDALSSHSVLTCPDQDMINIASQGRIKLLAPEWNYLWNYGFAQHRLPPDGPAWFADDQAQAASGKWIVHFSSAIKPWKQPQHEDADIFWQVARRSPAYLRVLQSACASKLSDMQLTVKFWRDQLQKKEPLMNRNIKVNTKQPNTTGG
jgi:lipopolysaccharide biosynthesis glycosyltransferase